MMVRPPNPDDWQRFIASAENEGWRVPGFELSLFQGPWSEYAHVLDDDGFCGMVTAVPYEKSAWIGNLIVPSQYRGKGYGTHLFKVVLADLAEQGMTSVWLTASEQGRSIYEREGFVAVGSVERWLLPAHSESSGPAQRVSHATEKLLNADSLAWGENRRLLLSEICKSGRAFSVSGAIALLQSGQDYQILGPWYSHRASMSVNSELLRTIMASRDPSVEMVIDCLTSSQLQPLLKDVGFQYSGQTTLMVYGDLKNVTLSNMLSLASLGSVG